MEGTKNEGHFTRQSRLTINDPLLQIGLDTGFAHRILTTNRDEMFIKELSTANHTTQRPNIHSACHIGRRLKYLVWASWRRLCRAKTRLCWKF